LIWCSILFRKFAKGTKNLDALHVLIANTDKLLEELKRENAGPSPKL
jgi:hypothetical protein